MWPKVHVLFIEDGTFKFQECEAQSTMDSTDPVDFGLKATCEIILVQFKMQAQACWLNGKRL